jgi:hypothetical protein
LVVHVTYAFGYDVQISGLANNALSGAAAAQHSPP